MNFALHGFIRIKAAAPPVAIANPMENARKIAEVCAASDDDPTAIVLTPELSLTGYSCEDLFFSSDLQHATEDALSWLITQVPQTCVVGVPLTTRGGMLVNCALVLSKSTILGAVPKSAIPNHEEFYEKRWFQSGAGLNEEIEFAGHVFPLSRNQLFLVGNARFAIEICEDLWLPDPPSTAHALQGADIILNLSASNELIGKADYRRKLVRLQSAKLHCGYIYAGSSPTESSKDVVFGGHLIAAENGFVLGESDRFSLNGTTLQADIDIEKLRHDRMRNSAFRYATRLQDYRTNFAMMNREIEKLERQFSKQPFVPDDGSETSARASEILSIQSTGLARRALASSCEKFVIGLSGGLDSTLALLVCIEAIGKLDWQLNAIVAMTMPGPGTSDHTLESVKRLTEAAGVGIKEIDIKETVSNHLRDIEHDGSHDATYENVQARERSQLLFDCANLENGLVVGTGDLSELALGWCTFNADHMSSYNVNVSVPKTLVAHLVKWYADHRTEKSLRSILHRILKTPISPELLPSTNGEITQQTEEILGPFELHDFFLFHMMRTGAGAHKLFDLALVTFEGSYDVDTIRTTLKTFYSRFYQYQFKRTTLPAGPKVGTVNLSPRGDWRMPDEADPSEILNSIDSFE